MAQMPPECKHSPLQSEWWLFPVLHNTEPPLATENHSPSTPQGTFPPTNQRHKTLTRAQTNDRKPHPKRPPTNTQGYSKNFTLVVHKLKIFGPSYSKLYEWLFARRYSQVQILGYVSFIFLLNTYYNEWSCQ